MDRVAGDRSNVHDRPFRAMQGASEPPAQRQRREQVERKDLLPGIGVSVETPEPLLIGRLGGYRSVVDQSRQPLLPYQLLRLGDKSAYISGIGEIRGDVVGPVRVALAFGRDIFPRTSDDLPAGVAEPANSRVPDPSARPRQDQGPRLFSSVTHGRLARRSFREQHRN